MQNEDEGEQVMFARTAGTPNSDTGLQHELKTTVSEEMYDAFLIATHNKGGRAGVMRDLVSIYLYGVPFAEHVAQVRRRNDPGLGRVIGHCAQAAQAVEG